MTFLEKYVELIIKVGVNIKKNQTLVISSPVDCKDFTRQLVSKAYECGARDVIVYWTDEILEKTRYEMAADDIFDEFPKWIVDLFNMTAVEDAAYIRLFMPAPELFKGLNFQRISRQNKAKNSALKDYNERIMSLKNSWCTISVPTESWAKSVFPKRNNAVDLLWDSIYKAARVDSENPVEEWKKHQKIMAKKIEYLNKEAFRYLHYSNSLGTDVLVELPEGHYWGGAMSRTSFGQEFTANIPTEEIFTVPRLDGVNGKVYSSMPLNYNGYTISDIIFTFKDGMVVDYYAAEGDDILKELLESDAGAKRIGEIALVPYDSPISKLKTVFYNSLLDENASCHFALGKAYPMVEGADKMDCEMRRKKGINDSMIHVDFMIGTKDLKITGIKGDGNKLPIFKNGNWF